ncbi:MAG: prepilin-type N-terminal cleavage/methylation domain-containing protein [Thermovirgaceae bacterium]|nr:prepilin-type N-terminal cleavage/methylation domain-containing protein [Thermovirgaceae bacterium]
MNEINGTILKKKTGFSLVETLLALVLLAVAVLSLALVPIATTKLFVHTADHERAILLATSLLERIESGENVGTSGTDGKFTWAVTSTPEAGTGGDIVTVQISWTSATGSRSSQMERLVRPDVE